MKFAKVVFIAAGIWGIGVLTPLYWLVDVSGRRYGVPTDTRSSTTASCRSPWPGRSPFSSSVRIRRGSAC